MKLKKHQKMAITPTVLYPVWVEVPFLYWKNLAVVRIIIIVTQKYDLEITLRSKVTKRIHRHLTYFSHSGSWLSFNFFPHANNKKCATK